MGAGSSGAGGGSFDPGAGSFDAADGSFDSGAGSFDAGAGSFDAGAVSFDEGAVSFDEGAGSSADGYGPSVVVSEPSGAITCSVLGVDIAGTDSVVVGVPCEPSFVAEGPAIGAGAGGPDAAASVGMLEAPSVAAAETELGGSPPATGVKASSSAGKGSRSTPRAVATLPRVGVGSAVPGRLCTPTTRMRLGVPGNASSVWAARFRVLALEGLPMTGSPKRAR